MNWLRVAWRETLRSGRLWCLLSAGLAVLAYAMVQEYPAFRERMEAMGGHLPKLAKRILKAKAGELTFENFAAVAYIHPVSLALMSVWPISRASQAVAGEIERGALGWHLAYPVGRLAFLAGKVLVMAVGVVAMQLVLFLAFRLSLDAIGLPHAGAWPYVRVAAFGALLYMAVGALTLWASAASSRAAIPNMVGAAIVVGSVLLENVGGAFPLFNNYRWLSLYHYFDYRGLITGAKLHGWDVQVLAACVVVGLVGAGWTFARRDLQI
ncbi:MAG: type transporter [Cyanobacteria bacterium RYN_339]|nr:type transporter [Cyanobacteria bacterium RYN_339]